MRLVFSVAASILVIGICSLAILYERFLPAWDESHFILGSRQYSSLAEQGGPQYYLARTQAELAVALAFPEPKIIFADGETGPGVQFEFGPPMPATMALGAANDLDLTRRFARWAGQGFRLLHIDSVFTPQADLFIPDSPSVIGWRSFGSSPDRVAAHTKAYVEGLMSAGIYPIVKHFPGHGLTPYDTHDFVGFTSAPPAVVEDHLKPFRLLTKTPLTFGIMVGHLNLDQAAGFGAASDDIMGRLRQDFGFKGLVVSDSVNMAPVKKMIGSEALFTVASIQHGADLILEPISPKTDYNAFRTAKQAGSLSQTILVKSHDRLAELQTSVAKLREIRPPATALWIADGEKLGWELLQKGCVAFGRQRSLEQTSSRVVRVGEAELSNAALESLEPIFKRKLSDIPEFHPRSISTTTSLTILYWPGGTGRKMNEPWTSQQIAWLETAREQNTPVTLVIFGNPLAGFQLRSFENVQGLIAWGRSTLSCKAAAAWLSGNFVPTGNWPLE